MRTLRFLMSVFFSCLIIFTLVSLNVSAQVTTTPAPKPRPNSTPQTPVTPKISPPAIYQAPPIYRQNRRKILNEGEFPAEKSLEVDSKVNIYLNCVSEGNVRINGWDRDEIRAYVSGGSEVGFKVTQKKIGTGKALQVNILGYDPQKHKELGLDECISGHEIEIDVPKGATISIKAGQSQVAIESVYKARVVNERGDLWLNDIAQGIVAQSFEGDVTVENSKGNIRLNNTSGSIIAVNIEPIELSDVFYAKTNSGAISIQSVSHTQVESNSISGMIKLSGDISSGGQYKLTTNSAILLVIPSQSSLVINATYGSFQSEITPTVDNISKNPGSRLQQRTIQIGSGEATVNLQTPGRIVIQKSTKN